MTQKGLLPSEIIHGLYIFSYQLYSFIRCRAILNSFVCVRAEILLVWN